MVQGGFHSVRAQAVGAAVHFILLDPQRCADLQQLAAVIAVDDARIVLRVVGPTHEHSPQVGRVIHIAAGNMDLFEGHSISSCSGRAHAQRAYAPSWRRLSNFPFLSGKSVQAVAQARFVANLTDGSDTIYEHDLNS